MIVTGMPGMSPPMKLKYDPNKSVKAVLKKYKLDDLLNDVSSWLDVEARTPAALKKRFLVSFAANGDQPVDYYDIDLNDPTSWGDLSTDMPMPPDEFFLELSKAVVADEKRAQKRSSYEF